MKTLQHTDQRPERPKDQGLPSLPPLPPPQATRRQVWGGKCVAEVRGPEWSHGEHPSPAKRLARAQDPACPLWLLRQPAGDSDQQVRQAAADSLNGQPSIRGLGQV